MIDMVNLPPEELGRPIRVLLLQKFRRFFSGFIRGVPDRVQVLAEGVEPGHLSRRYLKIEDLAVLLDPLGAGRLWDDHEPMLQAPSNHDLGGALGMPSADFGDRRVAELAPPGQGAVGLDLYPPVVAEAEQLLLVKERVELDLVDGGDHLRTAELLEVPDGVVAHAYGPTRTPSLEFLERLPRLLPEFRDRPVYQVEVDVAQPEPAQALVAGGKGRIVPVVAVPELGSDEDLL